MRKYILGFVLLLVSIAWAGGIDYSSYSGFTWNGSIATTLGGIFVGGDADVRGSNGVYNGGTANSNKLSLGDAQGSIVYMGGAGSFTTQYANIGGLANSNITVVGNGADTTEDNLMTYSLPAGALAANGQLLRVTAYGDGVSTADVTTVKCYFGATAVMTRILTASQANTWNTTFLVFRTGAATQVATATLVNGGTATTTVQTNTTPGETLSGAITVKCTGQRATTPTANSVRQLAMTVEFFN